jgi:hypothetical protein
MEIKSADKKIKLSPKQKEVIKDLQNGWSLCTSSDVKGAWVSKSKNVKEYHINNRVFWNLVDKGLIFKNFRAHFNYTLTALGKTIEL